MTLYLEVLTSNGVMLSTEAEEVILSTNSGQIGVLANHAPLLTGLDIGVLKAHVQNEWIVIAVLGGFAQIENNKLIVLVNDAEHANTIDVKEAESYLISIEAKLSQATNLRQKIEATLAMKRTKARLEAARALQSSIS